jgi:hypothetical protein
MALRAKRNPFLLELIEPCSFLAASQITVMKYDLKNLLKIFVSDRSVLESTYSTENIVYEKNQYILLVRVTTIGNNNVKELMEECLESEDFDINPEMISIPASRLTEPFEIFPELPAAAISQLCQKESYSAQPMFNRFKTYAQARFGSEAIPDLSNEETATAFFARWPNLIRRFLNHGPATNVDQNGEIPFSLGLVPRPQPYRSKIQDDGTLEMMLVHKDRLGHRRRYFVRPFGRYDNLVSAWNAAHDGDIPWVGRRKLTDSIKKHQDENEKPKVTLPQIPLNELDNHSLDIVIPRSEPLAPPVVLSAQRLDVGEGTQKRPGELIEFVVARHSEEIASESNVHVADSLQFEHIGVGFYREFRDLNWAKKITDDDNFKGIYAIAPTEFNEAKKLSFTNSNSFEEINEGDLKRKALPERITDGWRGITAIRTEDVPHMYSVHAAFFAAAGVVVSKPVIATVPESKFKLVWPWSTNSAKKTEVPTWEVTADRKVLIKIPLIRYLDGMEPSQIENWYKKSDTGQDVFHLPDPGVSYELQTSKVINNQRLDISTEFTFAADKEKAEYFAGSPSKMFKPLEKGTAPYYAKDWLIATEIEIANTTPISITLSESEADLARHLCAFHSLVFSVKIEVIFPNNSNLSSLKSLLTEKGVMKPTIPDTATDTLHIELFVNYRDRTEILDEIKKVQGVEIKSEKSIETILSLTLTSPLTDSELCEIRDALSSNSVPIAYIPFFYRLVSVSQDRVFGLNRQPYLQATKGFLDALSFPVIREMEK